MSHISRIQYAQTELTIFSSQPASPNVCLLLVNNTILLLIQARNLGLTLNHPFPFPHIHSHMKILLHIPLKLSISFFSPLHSNCLFLSSGPRHFTLIGFPPSHPTSLQSILYCDSQLPKGKFVYTSD